MKKIIFIVLGLFLLTGCGGVDKDKLINNFIDSVDESKSYYLKGDMEIYNGEDTFSYKMDVYYMDDDYFKVEMVNNVNNNEQIILRDKEAVYVVTPSLNKSYKFTSEWPYNSSQAYILSTLVKDIKNDDSITFEEVDGEYVLKAKVNYPNNSELTYQKLYFDSKMNLKAVDVFDKDDILAISVKFNKINYKAKLKEEDFNIDSIVDKKVNAEVEEENDVSKVEEDETVETATLEDVIYPLYVPADTYLKEKEMINTENGERAILTFNGAKNFVLIEETTVANQEYETIPVFGDPLLINDTIGVMSSNSLSWSDNNVNYYLASNDMSSAEILTVANSLNVTEYVGK
jgi:outer membrane lipoprotein-sorting protein